MRLLALAALLSLVPQPCPAQVRIETARCGDDAHFRSVDIPPPAINDAAADATWTLVSGQRSGNGAELTVLHDDKLPVASDVPRSNFFFQDGTTAGRIAVDLGKPITVRSIQTYSWHTGSRAPQVYKLYAAGGGEKGFQPAPATGIDPRSAGWQAIAKVDTRSKGKGGQHLVRISGPHGENLGSFRHLLFEFEPTEPGNPQSNTFLSEIDVTDAHGPAPQPIPEPLIRSYPSPDGKLTCVLDATLAPDLGTWFGKELLPVIFEWYPKMADMLPSEAYTAPDRLIMEFRDDMGDTPAYAIGNRLALNSSWFRGQLQGEAKGCIIHELVHIIQNYWRAASTNPNPALTPGWISEGIPDYIRWFIYEPETRGAEITRENFAAARHDSSYRISANFLDWVMRTHDKDLIRKLNAAAREGRYSLQLWQDATGMSLDELAAAWKQANATRLGL